MLFGLSPHRLEGSVNPTKLASQLVAVKEVVNGYRGGIMRIARKMVNRNKMDHGTYNFFSPPHDTNTLNI